LANLFGLGYQYWKEVTGVLRSIIPVYDKVNMAISLGKANKYREMGIKDNVFPGDKILDAGSGFGNMSRIAASLTDQKIEAILYDPLSMMLSTARNIQSAAFRRSLSSGVFEYTPFREQVFDAVLCGYSLRDAIELEAAISELYRVLKKGGSLVVVDLGKPDNEFLRSLVSIYLKYVLAIVAFFVAGQLGLKFKTIHGTYKKWPRNSELLSLLNRRFSKVKFQTGLLGAAIIVTAYK
jgi:demethylmenaquinone methyltransferase/2-methoxy-6-polyprenyl-1,4-benzoquinol methylase